MFYSKGYHLRQLLSVLSPIYWTTAHEVGGAYNGYSLTKGEFKREIQVEFTTGEKPWSVIVLVLPGCGFNHNRSFICSLCIIGPS